MTDTPTETTAEVSEHDQARTRALDAAIAVFDRHMRLYSPHRHVVEEALTAAADVMTEFELAQIDKSVQEAGFAGMDVLGQDVAIRLSHANDFARAVVLNFDETVRQRGCENYYETEFTITDPALKEAIDAGLPMEQWPPHRRYTFIVTRPEGKTPHQLRRDAEARVAELEQQLAAAQDDARRSLCQEIYDLAGNKAALQELIEDSGGDPQQQMSLARARSLLRSLAALGGVLDPDGDDWLAELLNTPVRVWFCPDRAEHPDTDGPTVMWDENGVAYCLADGCGNTSANTKSAARQRVEELAARRWEQHDEPALKSTGVPEDARAALKARYIADVCANREAVRQLLDENPDERGGV